MTVYPQWKTARPRRAVAVLLAAGLVLGTGQFAAAAPPDRVALPADAD
jgi:hypothetical protein